MASDHSWAVLTFIFSKNQLWFHRLLFFSSQERSRERREERRYATLWLTEASLSNPLSRKMVSFGGFAPGIAVRFWPVPRPSPGWKLGDGRENKILKTFPQENLQVLALLICFLLQSVRDGCGDLCILANSSIRLRFCKWSHCVTQWHMFKLLMDTPKRSWKAANISLYSASTIQSPSLSPHQQPIQSLTVPNLLCENKIAPCLSDFKSQVSQ